MQIISTNISKAKTVILKNKEVKTGIFKEPVHDAIYLDNTGVKHDAVVDRSVHGGPDKACYMYSVDYYGYWKLKYPELDWTYGMFGENLTVEGLNEKNIHLGDVYKIGEALVQAAQPRQPCSKLGVKFKNQHIVKEFVKYQHPGVYLRVMQPGYVKNSDLIIPEDIKESAITIRDLFRLLFQKEKDKDLLAKALNDKNLPDSVRIDLGV